MSKRIEIAAECAARNASFAAASVMRRDILKLMGAGGLALGLPPILAACSSGSASKAASGSGASSNSAQTISNIAWGLPTSTIVGLDIATAWETNATSVAVLGLEGLLGVADDLSLTPLLATAWKYDATKLQHIFTIREGVKFWDGTLLTPNDVAFSMNRYLAKTSLVSSYFSNVKSFSVTGANEVTLQLAAPDQLILDVLPFTPIFPEAFVQKVGNKLGTPGTPVNVVGTGPYIITEFSSATTANVERNPHYWGPKPVVASASFQCIPDPQSLQQAMESGSIQGTFGVPLQQAASWAQGDLTIQSAPSLGVDFISFDMTKAPWNDIHVRKALAYCADRTGYVKSFLGGLGAPATTLVPPAQWGGVLAQSAVESFYASLPTYPYDLTKAKAELAQSTVPHGFDATIQVNSSLPDMVKSLESLSESAQQIGINLNITPVTSDIWIAGLHARETTTVGAFGPDYADPADFLNIAYQSQSNLNRANFSDPTVDSLLAKANATSESATRAKYLKQVITIGAEQLPYLPLYWPDSAMAISSSSKYSGVSGLYYNPEWLPKISAA
jgi:peptide/nickel transport system substrate-binding protein